MTALKTVAMRVRGTDTKTMEEEGLETDGAVESKSKLRSKVKSLSGVDILTNTGAYKSTYQILSEIADVWGDINDMDQAALLELLAGKRSGSVVSAILQNPETLKEAFESANDAAGSAWKENEKYLDSIQGKIDLFTNAIQTMWNNSLNSNVLKTFISFATTLIQVIDKIGLLPSALIGLGSFEGLKLMFKSFKGFDSTGFISNINQLTMGTKVFDAATRQASLSLLKEQIQLSLSNNALIKSLATKYLAVKAEKALEVAKYNLKLAEMGLLNGIATAADVQAAQVAVETASIPVDITKMKTTELLSAAFKGFALSVWSAVKAVTAFLFTNPVGWLILAISAVVTSIALYKKYGDTVENLGKKLSDLKSELESAESQIDSLNSELEKTRERIAELEAMPSLSFTDAEELEKLKKQTQELERQLQIQEALAESQKAEVANTAGEYIDKAWNSEGADKAYYVDTMGVIHKDEGWGGFWNPGVDTTTAINRAIGKYDYNKNQYDKYNEIISQWDSNDPNNNKDLLARYGVFVNRTLEDLIDYRDSAKESMDDIAQGINMVFADENYEGLEYGMSDEIDAFLDEIYSYQLKWQNAQGAYVKSDAISSLFDSTATKDMQNLGKELREIADNDTLTDEQKNKQIEDRIDNIDKTSDAYSRLKTVMETVGVTAQDIADYFVLETGVFNSDTIEGVTAQYEKGIKLLEQFKATNNDANNARMKKLQEGGTVDLFDRPEISSSELVKKGWENAGDGISTVYTSTYSNEDGTVAINFTPILPDGQVLTPEELQEYAEGVIAGTRKDDLNLQIGAKFTGQNAIEEAVRAAEEIHSLQESFYMGDNVIEIEGIEYDWDELFSQDEEGKFKAKSEEFSKILKGMDEDCRKTFMSLAESAKNGEISWNQAIEKFSIASMQAVIKNMKSEMESLNKQIFKGLDDEISGIIDTFDEFSAALENVASSMDLLHTAQEQMNNSGQISVKTALELIASTDQWNQVLAIENGQIKLVDGAEQVLIQTKLDTIKSNIELALQEVNTSLAMLDAGDAAITLSDKLGNWLMQQIERVKRGLAWLDAAAGALWDNLWNGGNNDVVAAGNAAAAKVTKTRAQEISDLQKQKAELEKQKEILEEIGTVETFEDYYDYNKTPGDKYDDDDDDSDEESKLDKIQKKYERKISNLDNQKTYLQNEVDRLEAENKGISKSYYTEQIKLEEKKAKLLQQERKELTNLLNSTAEGSDDWWDVANALWEVDHAIQDSTLAIIEARKEIAALYKTAFDKLETAYENKDDIYDQRIEYIDKFAELYEIQDEEAPMSVYLAKIAETQNKQNNLLLEIADLEKAREAALADAEAGIEGGDETYDELTKTLNEKYIEYQENVNSIAEYTKNIKELQVKAFDIIRKAYDNRNDFYDDQQSYMEGYIDYLEASGVDATPEMYEKLIEIEKEKRANNVANLINARAGVEKLKAAGYTMADDELVDAEKQVRELEKAVQDNDIAIKQWEKDIQELEFEKFDKFAERVNNFNKELENVRKLIDDEDVAFEDGSWTKEGITNLAMLYHQIENNTNMIAKYNEEMAKLENQYKFGELSESEYTERAQELKDQQWELVLSNEELKDSIIDINEARIDLVEEGINKEVDAYRELIELKRDELSAERELYEFRQDVEDQTRDIAELERKIASLSGADDAASVAERRRLEAELRDKNKDLQNTYYDHAKDSQSTALDDEMEAYEKAGEDYIESLRDKLENVNLMIEQTLQEVLFNADVTFNELSTLATENNITLSQNLMAPWQKMSELATMTKDQIGVELLNLNEDSVAPFSDYAGTLLTAPFETGGIACTGFKTLASTQIAELQAQVYNASSDLLRDLSYPWTGAEAPINTFSQTTDAALQGAIVEAQAAAVKMTTSNEQPWKAGIGAAQLWSSEVEKAYDNAIKKSQEYAAQVAKEQAVSTPSYTTTKTTGSSGDKSGGGTNAKKKEAARKAAQDYIYSHKMREGDRARWGQDPNFKKLLDVYVNTYEGSINDLKAAHGMDDYGAIDKQINIGSTAYLNQYTKHIAGSYYYYDKNSKTYYKLNDVKQKKDHGSTMHYIPVGTHRYKYYAKGTLGTKKDQWAITDEPQFGDELVLVPTAQGNLSYMRKGTSIVPADITNNLVEWGQLDPNTITSSGVGANINIINSAVNKPEIKLDIENFLRCDNVSQDALPELEKFVNEKMNNLVKQLNYGLKKFK